MRVREGRRTGGQGRVMVATVSMPTGTADPLGRDHDRRVPDRVEHPLQGPGGARSEWVALVTCDAHTGQVDAVGANPGEAWQPTWGPRSGLGPQPKPDQEPRPVRAFDYW